MNYASIRTFDVANGEGVRVSLFVSGCTHRCKGCFNEEAQNFAYGKPFTREVEDELLKALESPYITGLTLLGGEIIERLTYHQSGVSYPRQEDIPFVNIAAPGQDWTLSYTLTVLS